MSANKSLYGSVLVALLFTAHVESFPIDTDSLCFQNQTLCNDIVNCYDSNERLSSAVAVYTVADVDENAFDLMNSSDVSNLQDFYVAMTKYFLMLDGFNKSVHQWEARLANDWINPKGTMIRQYISNLELLIQDIYRAVNIIRSKRNLVDPTPDALSAVGTTVDSEAESASATYSETAYVTKRLRRLLQLYNRTCQCPGFSWEQQEELVHDGR